MEMTNYFSLRAASVSVHPVLFWVYYEMSGSNIIYCQIFESQSQDENCSSIKHYKKILQIQNFIRFQLFHFTICPMNFIIFHNFHPYFPKSYFPKLPIEIRFLIFGIPYSKQRTFFNLGYKFMNINLTRQISEYSSHSKQKSTSNTSSPSTSLNSSTSSHSQEISVELKQKQAQKPSRILENPETKTMSPKSSEMQVCYQQKRSYIFNWLRKFCSKLRLSREAVAMTQIVADLYYSHMPYNSKQTRITLITFMLICSKFCDFKIIFPHQMAFIFQVEIQTLKRTEQDVLCTLEFHLVFPNYSQDLNYFLSLWSQNNNFQFFSESQKSYYYLCKAHALVQKIYELKKTIDKNDYRFVIKIVLDHQNNIEVDQSLNMIFGEQLSPIDRNLYSSVLEQVNKKWKQKDEQIISLYEDKKDNLSYEDFMIRYTFLQ